MSEDEYRTNLSTLKDELAFLPLIGFGLALSREGSFYLFLGVDPLHVLNLADLVKVSVFYVLPTVPVFLFSSVVGAILMDKSENGKTKIGKLVASNTGRITRGIVLVLALLYWCFGLFPQSGYFFFLMFLVWLYGPKLTSVFLEATKSGAVAFGVLLLVILAMILSSNGAREAMNIRQGMLDDYPSYYAKQDEASDTYLVRNLSAGALVATRDENSVVFHGSNDQTVSFTIDPEPFKGWLCMTFGWCGLSGWSPSFLTE